MIAYATECNNHNLHDIVKIEGAENLRRLGNSKSCAMYKPGVGLYGTIRNIDSLYTNQQAAEYYWRKEDWKIKEEDRFILVGERND